MAGKRFPEDFDRIDKIKTTDKMLIYDSKDGVDKYVTASQFYALLQEQFKTGIEETIEGFSEEVLGSVPVAKGEGESSTVVKNSWGPNKAGKNAFAEGYSTEATGEQSHSEGYETTASGKDSHAEGHCTSATNHSAHSEGTDTVASGLASHAEGMNTKATNHNGEHAEGKYNKSNTGTIHSVGIGTSDSSRKNAHEITEDGKHYILGIGGYDGTNPDKATDVASQLTELSTQGVVSQTLNYNTADNTYSVSNVVRGAIPSFFIDLVTEAGASFNAESGYFSLNGIDNIAYDEMRQIYDCRTGYGCNSVLAIYGESYKARTTFPIFRGFDSSFANHTPTAAYCKYLLYKNASILTCAFCASNMIMYVQADSLNNFNGASVGAGVWNTLRLEEIIGIIDVTNLTKSANFFYNGAHTPYLAEFKLKSLKASINISGMPRLSEASLLYMINNEKSTEGITIKLHADAKAMADASEAIQSALSNHANITLGV